MLWLHWRPVLSSGFLPAASALEARRQSVTGAIQGRVGRHEVESAAAGSHSRVPHSVLAHLPLGASEVPLGGSRAPTGTFARSHGEPRQVPLGARVGLSKRASKSEWEHQGRGSLAPLGPSPLARRHIAGSHSPARGAPRVPPLGGRATTVRAPLPLGYLPIGVVVYCSTRSSTPYYSV